MKDNCNKMDNFETIEIDIIQDIDLYNWACVKNKTTLIERFVNKLPHYQLRDQLRFINKAKHIHQLVLTYMKGVFTDVGLSQLFKVSINTWTSKEHKILDVFRESLIQTISSMKPIQRYYPGSHVVLVIPQQLDAMAEYYNGQNWCKIPLSETIRHCCWSEEQVDNIVCINNDMWILKGDKLFKANYVKSTANIYVKTILDKPDSVQLCSDGNRLILISNDMQVAEVCASSHPFKVSHWYKLEPNDYNKVFSQKKRADVYDINLNHYSDRAIRICLNRICVNQQNNNKDTTLFGIGEEGNVYCYEFFPGIRRFQQFEYKDIMCTLILPTPEIEGYFFLIPKENFKAFCENKFDVK